MFNIDLEANSLFKELKCGFCFVMTFFFKFCLYIDIRGEWFGIANGLNSFINNRAMTLD